MHKQAKKTCSVQAGEEGGTGPLLSAKLHKSWIADVQLLPADGLSLHAAALPTLLTASNDGSVRLWDLSKGCDGMPLELAHADDLHTGTAPACLAGSSVSCSIAQGALVSCSQGKASMERRNSAGSFLTKTMQLPNCAL